MATLPGYYTIDEAAEILEVHPSTVSRYISEKRIKAIDLGHQKLLEQGVVHGFEKPKPGNPEWTKKKNGS